MGISQQTRNKNRQHVSLGVFSKRKDRMLCSGVPSSLQGGLVSHWRFTQILWPLSNGDNGFPNCEIFLQILGYCILFSDKSKQMAIFNRK